MHRSLEESDDGLYAGVYANQNHSDKHHEVKKHLVLQPKGFKHGGTLCFPFLFSPAQQHRSQEVSHDVLFQPTPSPRTSIIPKKKSCKKHGILKFLLNFWLWTCLILHLFARARLAFFPNKSPGDLSIGMAPHLLEPSATTTVVEVIASVA